MLNVKSGQYFTQNKGVIYVLSSNQLGGEAQDVLNKFINDENNMKLIQQAALLISDSFKQS